MNTNIGNGEGAGTPMFPDNNFSQPLAAAAQDMIIYGQVTSKVECLNAMD